MKKGQVNQKKWYLSRETPHFKYYAWVSRGDWRGQKLLSTEQRVTLIHALSPYKTEMYESIQNYTKAGEIISCPIYIDFDGEDALAEARYLVWMFKDYFDYVPRIYFSGAKGFHIIIPYEIVHPQCHMVVKHFVNQIDPSLKVDPKVYRTRSMWRLENSRHHAGRYKIRLRYDELMNLPLERIHGTAWLQRWDEIEDDDISKLTRTPYFNTAISVAIKHGPIDMTSKIQDATRYAEQDYQYNLTPCLSHILSTPPGDGEWNHSIFLMARFFRACDIDLDYAISVMLKQSHYQESEKHVRKVFKSVYESPRNIHIGCREGTDSALMRKFCNFYCRFYTIDCRPDEKTKRRSKREGPFAISSVLQS